MKDLKQCPFCGGEGKLLTGVSKDKPYARIYCDKCRAVTQGIEDSECDGSNIDKVVELWNTRYENNN